MNVVLTREVGQNDELRSWVGDHAAVIEVPLTTTHYRDLDVVRREMRALPRFGIFRALVVTSARSGDFAPAALAALAADAAVLSVGPATTKALADAGVSVTGEGAGRAVDLASLIDEGPVLVIGAAQMRDELSDALAARGVEVVRVACYETLAVSLSDADVGALRRADVVLIGAPSAWRVAQPHVGPSTWIVVPGATTADAVRRDHGRVIEQWGAGLGDALSSLPR